MPIRIVSRPCAAASSAKKPARAASTASRAVTAAAMTAAIDRKKKE